MDNSSRLYSLSRDLSLSTTHALPEEYIKETLLAHGFFQHSLYEEKQTEAKTKEKQPGCRITEEDKRRTTQLISQIKEGKEVHKLKEPRKLFNQSYDKTVDTNKQQLPFWPINVECLSHCPKLQGMTPAYLEAFYVPERDVISPKIRSGDNKRTTVYINPRGPEKYFATARAGPSCNIKSVPMRAPNDVTLIFESRFESGNLAKVVQVGKWDYELYLSFDLYTKKHTQWFYFSVSNMRKGQSYRFTIVNLYKAGSLYNEGLQPVMYSIMDAKLTGVGWRRRGHNIKYFKTPLKRVDTKAEACYFGLTWSHTFEHENDTCYFAHCYPYTYTDLLEYLHIILSNPVKSEFCKKRTLCHTLAGNPVPILTITSPTKSPEVNVTKKAVVITSRIHPGETNGSWMMKGLLDFLTGNSPDAQTLRNSFVFKIVPMMNPDGVIVGNYRCSLSGRDLNRNYRTKYSDAYPTVWYTKAMVQRLVREREVVLYCDLHGHSRKQNVFIYGCDSMDDRSTRLKSRIFPKMLCKNTPAMFSYESSKFGVHKSKWGTGRVVMWKEMGVTNSYTMEATFCGSLQGKMAGFQFRSKDFERMGHQLCDTLLDYCDPDQAKAEHILHQLEEEYRVSVVKQLSRLGQTVPPDVDPLNIELPEQFGMESSDVGSDSSESDGLPVHFLARERRKKTKRKLKSRRERNKQKAVMKLSHYNNKLEAPPTSTSHLHPTQPRSTSSSRTHLGGSSRNEPPLVPKNGGIPIFIQERLDQKQRKKGDLESMDGSGPVPVMEDLTQEYLKQGMPPHPTEGDPCSSTVFQSHSSDCPISITSVGLCVNGWAMQTPSMMSTSRKSQPQLIDACSHGVSTSNYLANHLQDIISTHPDRVVPPPPPPANNTRNLTNLSRLFRQLRPHQVNTEQQSKPEKNGLKDGVTRNPNRVEFHDSDNIDSKAAREHNSKQLMREHLEGSNGREEKRLLHSSSSERIGSDLPTEVHASTTSSRDNLHRPAVLTTTPRSLDGCSSHSSLGRASSSLTNSWESFTKPIQLVERGDKQLTPLPKSVSAPIQQQPPHPPSSNQLTPITEHYYTPHVTKHSLNKMEAANDMSAAIIEHKQYVSQAVDTYIHSDRRRRKLKKRKKYARDERRDAEEEEEEDVSPVTSSETTARVHSAVNLGSSTNHTPFWVKPHPLMTNEDLSPIL